MSETSGFPLSVSLQALGIFGDRFIRHRSFLAELDPIVSELDKNDATFKEVPGLASSFVGSVSYRSVNSPDRYLRHRSFRLTLQPRPVRGSESELALFDQDATFFKTPGLADQSKASFRSVNFQDRFLRHRDFHIFLDLDDGSPLFKNDATFTIRGGFVDLPDSMKGEAVRVMTYNMYVGSYFKPLWGVQSEDDLKRAVSKILREISDTEPIARAKAVAARIASESPDLVGLQEAYIVRKVAAGATTLIHDQTQSLLDSLSNYQVVAVVPGNDLQVPSADGFGVRFTYRTVMIARRGIGSALALSNVQVQHFLAKRIITFGSIQSINTRGWAAVDVTFRGGRAFRFMTTHLDGVQPGLTQDSDRINQLAQAKELLAAAGGTGLPVVMVGDFNVAADDSTDPTHMTYKTLTTTGSAPFKDAWTSPEGFTCCQLPGLDNDDTMLRHRFDLVLYRGFSSVQEIKVLGDKLQDHAPKWPSDHGGVVASLKLS